MLRRKDVKKSMNSPDRNVTLKTINSEQVRLPATFARQTRSERDQIEFNYLLSLVSRTVQAPPLFPSLIY